MNKSWFHSLRVLVSTSFALVGVSPASSQTAPSTPGGVPCVENDGSGCKASNLAGTLGGTTVPEIVAISSGSPADEVASPPTLDRGVFISQVGDGNEASVIQNQPNAYASVTQIGTTNEADLTQSGTGPASLVASQTGSANFLRMEQSGNGGNFASSTQAGNSNWLWSHQQALGGIANQAILTQVGNNNDLSLWQDGRDNLALLSQEGNDNAMTAVQHGDGNRLKWTQTGNNLSDLKISQYGGATAAGQLVITQSNSVAGH